jgi:type IV pilus assembly protein PilE
MQKQIRTGKPASKHQRGFTLIEVMIVVAIVAILAAFAIPQYREYVLRGQLVSATNLLSTFQARMERHFQDNRTYETVGAFTTPCNAPLAQRTDENFVLTCTVLTPTTFTLHAQGSGPTANFQFTVTNANVRATPAVPTGWATCATKWVLKRGQAC